MEPQVCRNPHSQNSKFLGIPNFPAFLQRNLSPAGQQGRRGQHFLHEATPESQELNPLVPFLQYLSFHQWYYVLEIPPSPPPTPTPPISDHDAVSSEVILKVFKWSATNPSKLVEDRSFHKSKGKMGLSLRDARLYLEQRSRPFATGGWVSLPRDLGKTVLWDQPSPTFRREFGLAGIQIKV